MINYSLIILKKIINNITQKKIYIFLVLILFLLDRISKIYLLNLQSSGIDVDFYITQFLNLGR